MSYIERSALVPYSSQQMYHLVNDVLSYPEFLPDCVGSQIISQSETEMIASIDIAKLGIKKSFSTHNYLIKNEKIKLQLNDGPFKKLEGLWEFTQLGDMGCKIEFKLTFEFSNQLTEMMFGNIFNELTTNLVNAFTQRAKQVYSNQVN